MRGIVFTILLSLMALSLLSISLVFLNQRIVSNQDLSRFGVYERIDNEIKYTESSYRKIIDQAVSINISGNNISFEEYLPNNYSLSNIDNLAYFLESRSDFALKINTENIKNYMGLVINPGGIVYNHSRGFGNNSLRITNTAAIISYGIYADVSLPGSINASCSCSEGSDKLVLSVTTKNESRQMLYNIDFGDLSSIAVFTGSSRIDIAIGGFERGSLDIYNANNIAMKIKTEIELPFSPASAGFPSQTINIISKDYNISKVGGLRVK